MTSQPPATMPRLQQQAPGAELKPDAPLLLAAAAGSNARLKSKLRAWTQGANLTIAAIGASITAGQRRRQRAALRRPPARRPALRFLQLQKPRPHHPPTHPACPPPKPSAGQGVVDGMNCTWMSRLESLLRAFSVHEGFGPISQANGGVPGATSMFVSVCVKTFVPSNADVVFVEFASWVAAPAAGRCGARACAGCAPAPADGPAPPRAAARGRR
jgi:hypothetical protein